MSMIINDDILRRDTLRLMKQIETQITEVNKHAVQLGVEAHQLRDANGNWVMIPLLLAKTQAYAMLIQLQTQK